MLSTEQQLTQRLGRQPRRDEIAHELGLTNDELSLLLRIAQQPTSLERPVGEAEDGKLADLIADERAQSPFDSAVAALRRQQIERALQALPERERTVIKLRFGLNNQPSSTLEQVGQALGLTRERIRQLEISALAELASLPQTQTLNDEDPSSQPPPAG